ncbi:iron-containing alcohol dehydrogenase [Geotalea daltonii FRC-32]|uniref:Iron-containing alcohol dehydrogenase n=1 Tax=Geotalea daltonii (strain DSM 22248 / JCM 15807 / FRC-32) TaxID=316067 RepID=B9M976_GEODF|nr:alcohol dehydrogenase-like regulatory protein ErcA [Geotalea daltonii]ACM18634.1 iron-containing alcohol dehydrogenase [Geotalea daltonii FRC-32]
MEPSEFQLRKFVAPEFIFGIDARKLAGRYARNFGARKVLVVTDPGVIAAGWTEEILASLRSVDLDYTLFSAVTSNPKAEEVMVGAELYRSSGCNAILAVGGGSPMDCAKGIGIVSSNRRHVLEFEGVDKVDIPTPPLICIPTTAGSGADVSQFAIITDTGKKVKIAIISKTLVPDVALIDPVVTTTMPAALTAFTALDALCHSIEAFVSTAHSPITDVHALHAMQLVTANLLPTLKEPDNMVRRGRMVLGSLQAGLAFSNASLGAVHAMAHSLGGFLGCAHGECNAILLPHVIDYNFESMSERYLEVAKSIGLNVEGMPPANGKNALTSFLQQLIREAGVPYCLGQLGISRDDIPELAKKAMNDPCIFTNPRQMRQRDIEAIYDKAF